MNVRVSLAWSVVLVVSMLTAHIASAADPARVWEQIHEAGLDPTKAVQVDGLNLDMGMGTLRFQESTLR